MFASHHITSAQTNMSERNGTFVCLRINRYSLKDKRTTDLRPASVLIFQRQGDWGAGGQLDKMKKVVNKVARPRGKSDGDDEHTSYLSQTPQTMFV